MVDLRPTNFLGGQISPAEDLPDTCPRYLHAVPGIVRAGPFRSRSPAARAVEDLQEEHGLDAEFTLRVLRKDPLSGIKVIYVPHTAVIAANARMGASVVAHDDRVQHGLPRTGEHIVRAQCVNYHPVHGIVD